MFKHKKNILVIGSKGMLGQYVYSFFSQLSTKNNSDINIVHALDATDKDNYVDISDYQDLFNKFNFSVHYDYVINCAAITNTTAIEGELKDLSYKVNALGCLNLAKVCKIFKSKLIHFSTDYVFSENSLDYIRKEIGSNNEMPAFDFACSNQAFHPEDNVFPINTYGEHKLLGELFIKQELPEKQYLIIRVSWLYGM